MNTALMVLPVPEQVASYKMGLHRAHLARLERQRLAVEKVRIAKIMSHPRIIIWYDESIEPLFHPKAKWGVFKWRDEAEPIIYKTAREYGITAADILSHSRLRKFVTPRQKAIYKVFMTTDWSWLKIARRFGGRDHTTALHSVRKYAELNNLSATREGV